MKKSSSNTSKKSRNKSRKSIRKSNIKQVNTTSRRSNKNSSRKSVEKIGNKISADSPGFVGMKVSYFKNENKTELDKYKIGTLVINLNEKDIKGGNRNCSDSNSSNRIPIETYNELLDRYWTHPNLVSDMCESIRNCLEVFDNNNNPARYNNINFIPSDYITDSSNNKLIVIDLVSIDPNNNTRIHRPRSGHVTFHTALRHNRLNPGQYNLGSLHTRGSTTTRGIEFFICAECINNAFNYTLKATAKIRPHIPNSPNYLLVRDVTKCIANYFNNMDVTDLKNTDTNINTDQIIRTELETKIDRMRTTPCASSQPSAKTSSQPSAKTSSQSSAKTSSQSSAKTPLQPVLGFY